MKTVKIIPNAFKGKIKVPSSKSFCHRSIICSSLAKGRSEIKNIYFSRDIAATIEAMRSLGAKIEVYKDSVIVNGADRITLKNDSIFCGESGSTIRFIIPIIATLGKKAVLSGQGKLIERPLDVYYKIFEEQGIYYKNSDGKLPLEINGKLKPGKYMIRGDISSQFITGLLFALPLLKDDSQIEITTTLESKPYVDMTLDIIRKFGIIVENIDYKKFIIPGNQSYKSFNYTVEADFSQAAFLLAMGLLGERVSCEGMNINSCQGDRVIVDLLKKMGADIKIEGDSIISTKSQTKGIVIDASQCPDLVPIIAAVASVSCGTTEIINAARLRIKESDRLTAISSQLNKIGASVYEKSDGLVIKGKKSLEGGEVSSFNDHRIAMSLAAVSSMCKNALIINGADCVNKSYPDFWRDFVSLGGNIEELK
ncbi:3-phosphoshikimate 1-carboxyvinyltransferase [Clostridium sp.]|jgi:3-phosphoshikimate 1-carboxyvinyltransferase|uniref:3-phosphoshikimate 1-carboxyvinyltransferase n=1 Tax=Clostridium sp. TaxID=1506 RepID=UPI003A5C0903